MSRKKCDNTLSSEISTYLVYLAEQLNENHASVMIGAGFSRNADSNDPGKSMPLWNNLKNIFFKKIYGREPSQDEYKNNNVITLADEVLSKYEKKYLERIIIESISDMQFKPSPLHEKLLNFPWVDIFTTNYDTLLERTIDSFQVRNYSVINKPEDLRLMSRPRIIKLHGTIPSHTPLIITSEDYATYPTKYSLFVNTVKQTMIENILILIGFSGDDPNFISWIDWIKNNFSEAYQPKMYFIGYEITNDDKRIFSEKNIMTIDVSVLIDSEQEEKLLMHKTSVHDKIIVNNYYKALTIFFNELKNNIDNISSVDLLDIQNWPNEEIIHYDSMSGTLESQAEKAIKIWEKTRKEYGNWLIMPYKRRESLLHYIKNYNFLYEIERIKKPLDLKILYEFNWRLEKSFHILLYDWAKIFRTVIDSYNPFPENIQIEGAVLPDEYDDMDWTKIRVYWIEIHLSLLSFYRQEGLNDDWDLLSKRLYAIKNDLLPEQNAKYHYERCLKQLFALDIFLLRKELQNWETNSSFPHWAARKAGLLAEIGDLDDAIAILKMSLEKARENSHQVKNDYFNISQEAYIMLLLNNVENATGSFSPLYEDNLKEYRKRWKEIAKYECDPWSEYEKYEVLFKTKPPQYKNVEINYGFNIGSRSRLRKYGSDEYTLKAYSFLKFIENTGIPSRLSYFTFCQNITVNASERIAYYSSKWAQITFIRTGNENRIEELFGRKTMANMKQEEADRLGEFYLEALQKSVFELNNEKAYNRSFFAITIAKIIPQILARLCAKNSYNVKIKILKLIKNIYSSKIINYFEKISFLTENIINSLSNKEQQKLFPFFLEFCIIPDNQPYYFPDPFQFVNIKRKYKIIARVSNKNINKALLTNEIIKNNDNPVIIADLRKKYITRLSVLWHYEQLNDAQIEMFAQILWEKRKKNGFPDDVNYYEFVFMRFPYPQESEFLPQHLFREYIYQADISFGDYSSRMNNGIDISGGHSAIVYNLLGTYNKDISYVWDNTSINNLLEKIIDWWNYDKGYLIEKTGKMHSATIYNEFKARFNKMITIFICVFSPNIEIVDKKYTKSIKMLLNELSRYNMNDLAAKASFNKIFPNYEEAIITSIKNGLISQKEELVFDALNATIVFIQQKNENIYEIISLISQIIKLRSKANITSILNTLIIIIKYHSHYINDNVINDINIGLTFLLNETELDNEDDIETIHKKLECRIGCIKLLLVLKKYFIEKNIKIPNYMYEWKNRCLNINGFSEIRNTWINNE